MILWPGSQIGSGNKGGRLKSQKAQGKINGLRVVVEDREDGGRIEIRAMMATGLDLPDRHKHRQL